MNTRSISVTPIRRSRTSVLMHQASLHGFTADLASADSIFYLSTFVNTFVIAFVIFCKLLNAVGQTFLIIPEMTQNEFMETCDA